MCLARPQPRTHRPTLTLMGFTVKEEEDTQQTCTQTGAESHMAIRSHTVTCAVSPKEKMLRGGHGRGSMAEGSEHGRGGSLMRSESCRHLRATLGTSLRLYASAFSHCG